MRHLILPLLVTLSACSIRGEEPPAPASALFAASWNAGLSADEPRFQAQAIDEHTFAIRQAIRTTFEAPFLYLLIGQERALLIDTGDGNSGLRAEVDRLIQASPRTSSAQVFPLVVMHSHGHTDHVGADPEFAGRANTVIVGHSPTEVAEFFGIRDWPNENVSFDLGGRVVDVLPTPGHQAAHVVVFDRATRMLFTGDAVYPGILRFQCGNTAQYLSSIERVRDFASSNGALWLLGAHIEMRAAAGAYYQSPDQPRRDEHRLELAPSVLNEIAGAVRQMGDRPRVEAHDDFVLFPHPANPRGLQPPDWCDANR
jgi:hydroxyacylglutathione hydrolase